MASNYPGGLDNFATNHTAGQTIVAGTDNDQADAVNKIEAELGANPSGALATVAARLAAAEAAISNGDTATLNSARAYADSPLTITNVVGSRNFAAGDLGDLLVVNVAATLTIPAGLGAVGDVLHVVRIGASTVTLAASGATLHTGGAEPRNIDQWGRVELAQVQTNLWVGSGSLS